MGTFAPRASRKNPHSLDDRGPIVATNPPDDSKIPGQLQRSENGQSAPPHQNVLRRNGSSCITLIRAQEQCSTFMENPLQRCTWNSVSPQSHDACLGEQEATDALVALIEAASPLGGNKDIAEQFGIAVLQPPLSKSSLRELDIGSIITNAKLRHDINYDRELHFRPNLDGPKGLAKKEAQKGYWKAITGELILYKALYATTQSQAIPPRLCLKCHRLLIQKRLRLMFDTIRDVLKNLVPERDQKAVEDGIDVAMLMQEIEREVCDFVTIAESIALLLKRHCAPMRDEMVDGMVVKMKNGDAASISAALCDLFGILEAMKLDVANHQIRHLRGPLIEDTVNFEQKYHKSRIEQGKFDATKAWEWYREQLNQLEAEPQLDASGKVELRAFVRAVVRHLLSTSRDDFPETFNLDARRLRGLQAEIQDLRFLNICLEVFEKLVTDVSVIRHVPQSVLSNLQNRLEVIGNVWNVAGGLSAPANFGYVIAEMVRQCLRACGIRTVDYNATLGQRVQQRLCEALADRNVYNRHEAELEIALTGSILATIEEKKYLNASPCDIFNALVPPPPPPTTPIPPLLILDVQQPPAQPDRQKDIALRITHVAVLHWQTWAKIVYLNDEHNPKSLPAQERARSPCPASSLDMPQHRQKVASVALMKPLLPPTADQSVVPTATLGDTTPD